MRNDRRTFLTTVAISGAAGAAGSLLASCSRPAPAAARTPGKPGGKPDDDDEVTPAEDLMREHGVLRRVMYLYDEAADRLLGLAAARDAAREVPLDALAGCAGIVRRVIEDYHEKLEEDFVFPRFEKAGKLAELTAVLRRQHLSGRAATEQITRLARARLAEADRRTLAAALRGFNRMYRPHAAREDTVLFPEFRGIVGAHAYGELGDQFEAKETEMLGDHGFEHAVAEVARFEQAFGLDFAALTAAP